MSCGTLQSLEQKRVKVQPMAHQTLSGAQAKAPRELAALGVSQSHFAIITGLSGVHRTI
jgi:DNA-binding transcriptional regulator YiaG